MNNDIFKGKWTEIKGEIQNMWGKLTHDDLERTKGNMTAIGGLIQQRYGESKEDVSKKLDSLVQRYSAPAAEKTERVKDNMRDADSSRHV